MEQPDPGREVLELMCGAWLAQALYVAAELGIADLLVAGPMPVTALSSASGCADPDGLYRVLRLLASHGIFHEDDEQVFSLAPMGARLGSDVPGSMRDLVIFYGAESYQAWGGLLHGVRTGESPFRAVFDDLFGYLRARPARGSVFNGAMAASAPFFEHLAAAYEFPNGALVVDVGGGSGAMLAAILVARSDLRGMIVDQAEVIDDARRRMASLGLTDRCAFEPGDFFEHVPAGGGVYVLSRILHDWADDRCVDILANCRSAMTPDSRLLIVERLLPEANTRTLACEFDVQMLVMAAGGRERDVPTYTRLLSRAGLSLMSVISLVFDVSVLECGRNPSATPNTQTSH